MAKFVVAKTIEARKLNRRTRLPTGEAQATIPYGGIIENPEQDGDVDTFTYLGELYQCRHEVLQAALEKGPAAEAREPARAEPAAVKLRWETIPSTHGEVRRAKAPGGWLVAAGGGVTFLPDPEHGWDGGSVG
jgi:hypothetical protein